MNTEKLPSEKNIELHHESIEAIMGTPPSIILRIGSGLLLTIFVGLLLGSIFFTYPDVVQAPGLLLGEPPISTLTAPEKGRIKEICKSSGIHVNIGDTLLSIVGFDKRSIAVVAKSSGLLEISPLVANEHTVKKNDTIALIWSDDVGSVSCVVELSPEQGKNVKAGNKLRLHIDKYPSDKYGTVESQIKSISNFNTGKNIQAIAELPESIVTTNQFEFSPRGNIYASCDIITGEKSIFNRLVNPFRGLLK